MAIGNYIKEIGRGARGARALTRAQASDLMGQVLDGQANDLELGAFCAAMRIKGETADEMCGFIDAAQARITPIAAPAAGAPLIVLPSYNGARRLPVLTPLLALLLAREGFAVLLHGMATETGRVQASEVLAALGIAPLTAPTTIAPGCVAHLPTTVLHPGLARLLTVRQQIGLRSSGHSLVKLLVPCDGAALLVSSYTHADYFKLMASCCTELGLNAVLSRGLEGESAADPRRQPRYDAWLGGRHALLSEQGPGTAEQVPSLPSAIDSRTTADWTQRVLADQAPVPQALAQQVAHIVHVCRQMNS